MKIEIKQGGGFPILLVVLLIISLWFGYTQYKNFKAEKVNTELISKSFNHYQDSLEYVTVKLNDSLKVSVAKVKTLYVDKQNLVKLYSEEVNEAKKLGLRVKDLQSLQQMSTHTAEIVKVPVYVDSLQRLCTTFKDSFTSITACIPRYGDGEIDYSINDSIKIIEYYKPHQILWGLIKWSSRDGEFAVFSKNPKTTITGFRVEKVLKQK